MQFQRLVLSISVILLIVLVACTTIKEREIDMVVQTAVPAIDTIMPTKVETATFSLG